MMYVKAQLHLAGDAKLEGAEACLRGGAWGGLFRQAACILTFHLKYNNTDLHHVVNDLRETTTIFQVVIGNKLFTMEHYSLPIFILEF